MTDTMLAIDVPTPGGPEALVPTKAAVPEIRPDEVLIRVAVAGINYPDLLQRQGRYDQPPGHSPRLGLEVSGEIAAIGSGVENFAVGDVVLALCNGGGYAEYVAVPAGQVLPLPQGVTMVQAGAMAETWFTVQHMLMMHGHLQPGMSVLIHGAAGGIGSAAIALCLIHGARPIAVVSSEDKAWAAKELGAKDVIIHTQDDFVAAAKALTDGSGVDRIVNFAGGDILARNMVAAARGAIILQLASLDSTKSEIPVNLLLGKALTLFGATLRPQPIAVKAAIAQGLLSTAWPAFASGTVKLPRLRAVPLADAVRAHRALEDRTSYGKIVLLTPFGESFVNDNSVAPA
jgi:putative PIG3 family NAD(P)H quinone oxidoreductase